MTIRNKPGGGRIHAEPVDELLDAPCPVAQRRRRQDDPGVTLRGWQGANEVWKPNKSTGIVGDAFVEAVTVICARSIRGVGAGISWYGSAAHDPGDSFGVEKVVDAVATMRRGALPQEICRCQDCGSNAKDRSEP